MYWEITFFLAGLVLLSAWGYQAIKEHRKFTKGEGETALTVRYDNQESMANIAVPDVFDESRIKSDLMRLASSPTAIGKYIAQAQIRFTQARQIQVLNRWTEFYKASEAVIRARTELARAHGELTQVAIEGEVNSVEKDAKIADYRAKIAESQLRAAEAEKKLADLKKEPTPEKKLTAEQERVLKKAEIEGNISRLRQDKKRVLDAIDQSDEDARMRTTNMYDDRIAREEEQLSRYL